MILARKTRFRNVTTGVACPSMIAKLKDDDEPALLEAKLLVRNALTWILQFVEPGTQELGDALPARLSLQLQRVISEFGRMYHERDLGPERMLVDLKAVIREVTERMPEGLRTKLMSEIVRWCITAYYVEGGSAD